MTAPRALVAPVRRRPAPAPRRPELRLVPPPEVALARRRGRLLAVATVVLVCAGLFAIIGLRVMLIGGQARIDMLEVRVDEERTTSQRLGLQVDELESPERVVKIAQDRLAMIPPVSVTPLRAFPQVQRVTR